MTLNRRSFLHYGAGLGALAAVGATRTGTSSAKTPWGQLAARLRGRLVLPSDSAYAVAKQLYFSQYDTISPSAVAYCADEADVRTCVLFAQDQAIHAVARSGGHSHAGYSTTPGLVIDLSALNGVGLSGVGSSGVGSSGGPATVAVGAGVQLVDALSALAPRGLALVSGSCPTVGAAGFLQGGGYGLLTRSAGMACDHIVSARVVLADGTAVTCSEQEHPDLFWALRGGGGGNFGIVTGFRVRPVGISRLLTFTLTWDWANALDVLGSWQDWTVTGPRELGADLTIALPDAAPGTKPVVTVTGAWTGDAQSLGACLDGFAAAVGSAPLTRQVEDLAYQDAMMGVYGCGHDTVPECHRVGYSVEALLARSNYLTVRNRMFSRRMPDSGAAALLAALDADRRAGHTRIISGACLGGRVNDLPRDATGYVHRTTQFQLLGVDTVPLVSDPDAAERAAAAAWTANVFRAMDPYSNGESYQNMPDPALPDWQHAYYAENYPRLVAAKSRYDPHRFFRFPQAIG